MKNLGGTRILLLAMLADVVGAVVIVGILPLAFSTSLVVLAVYASVVFFVTQTLRRRSEGG